MRELKDRIQATLLHAIACATDFRKSPRVPDFVHLLISLCLLGLVLE